MSYLVADLQDRPVSVLFSLDLLERLRRQGRDSRGGVLYGRTDTSDARRTLVTVEACEPAHGLAPVGLVRSWVRGHLYLDKQEREVLGGAQPVQPYSVLLVVRRAMLGTPVAGAFLCEAGAVVEENSFAEFPLDRSRIQSGRFTVLTDAGAPVPEFRKPPISRRPRFRMSPWAWIPIGAIGVALLALFALTPRQGHTGGATTSIIEPGRESRILLSLQRAGNDLLLRWDPDNPKVRGAGNGVLRITDGNIQRTVPLDSSQLQIGAAQYHPVSSDVEFELDIPGANGARSDPVRFISGTPAPLSTVVAKSSELPGETATNGESDRTRVDTARRMRPSPRSVRISYEPIAPSPIRKAVNRMRGVSLLRFRSGDFVAPRATRQVTPTVPAAMAGRLQLRANIDKNGRVTNVQPLSSTDDQQLVTVAKNAISHWEFTPARQNNRPVASSARFTVRVEPR